MYDEIYIDIVFMANFLMDYVLLRLVLMVLHYRRKRFWCVLGAILGAVFSCIYVILPGIVPGALLQAVLSEKLTEKLKHLKENPGELRSTELTGLRPKLIPCRTVAGEVRMLPAVTLEKLCIHTLDEQICVSSPVFAVLFEPSALGKEYKVLLNSRLLH